MTSLLSERVEELLSAKQLSKTQIAEKVGVDYTTLWRKLRGARGVNTDFLLKLAEALGTSAAYLLGETDNPNPLEEAQENGVRYISNVTLDLENMIKDLMYEQPDLAIGFRDARENWQSIPNGTKVAIAKGLMELFDPAKLDDKLKLKKIGKRGRV